MKFWNVCWVIALTAFSVVTAQGGTLYKWVGKDGKVSYHDQPPPENSGYRVEEKNLGSRERVGADTSQAAAEKFPIVIYTTARCAGCDLARAYLEKRKVPYSEKNVESDPKLQEELKKKSGSLSVPTITIGEKVMNGYLESLLEGELDQAGYLKAGSAARKENKETPETEDK
ncbi:MAG: glutaredoxin family protein [Pseudomonadota bacterium]